MTVFYAILHMLVDGLCALAMFGVFIPREDGYLSILLYNFCAFALQMPLGVLIDALCQSRAGRECGCKWQEADIPFLIAIAGAACTIVGAVSHPVVLGIGNALFHVGGGVGAIQEDFYKGWKGKGLGVFVAPGAFGLYLGTLAGKGGLWLQCFLAVSILMALLCLSMAYRKKRRSFLGKAGWKEGAGREGFAYWQEGFFQNPIQRKAKKERLAVPVCCFLVVALRSYLGMSVAFPWKVGAAAGALSVFALVFGKMAGGFLTAHFGAGRVAAASLALAAFCYLCSGVMPMGLAALLLFNMTMPITLYWMACRYPKMPGLAFGILTFALFLGFLPGYFGCAPGIEGNVLGCVGSLLSLAFMGAIGWMMRH